MKVFRSGAATEYQGARKSDGIISYMKKQALPAVSILTAENHKEFSASDKIVVIAYLSESDSANKKVFETLAESQRDDYLFGLTTDSAAISAAGVSAPAVVLYKTFDEGRNDYTGSFVEDSLVHFIKDHATPLLDEISPENFATYAEAGLPLAYIFVEAEDKNRASLVKSLEPVAREYKGKVNFVWIDAQKFSDHAKALNLQEAVWPAFAIQDIHESLKFPLSQSTKFSAEAVADFTKRFVAGEIKPSIKSEPIPSSQDEPVYVIVADNFDTVTADKSKDLFIEFYAPWCGHCKKLAPTWETLAERYAGSKDKLLIAKFDAHNNDIPNSSSIKVQGFPTIKFRPAGSDEWLDYQGDRSLESLIEYIQENAANEVKPDEGSTDTAGKSQVVLGNTDEDEEDEAIVHNEL